MARKVKKMGNAPRVETIVADGAVSDVILTWESRQYENGLTETIKNIRSELKESEGKKPKLILPMSKPKEIKG